MKEEIYQLHMALLDIAGLLNQPQRDTVLIREAGVSIDRALFPLLVRIERRGPLGVVELAGLVGRDYTTVSRQVTKLETMGLITRRALPSDRRVSEVAITAEGKNMTDALDAARERLISPMLSQWSDQDRATFIKLLRRFADDYASVPGESQDSG